MKFPLEFLIDRLPTPIGELIFACDLQGHLRMIDWLNSDANMEARMQRLLVRYYGAAGYILTPERNPFGLTTAIAAYFDGDLHALDSLPTTSAGTAFQREVWRALRTIPVGETISYSELAQRIRRPRAVRAVGLANGANPVGVVIPCHRVIGASGALTGYGSGLHRKRWLLEHESRAAHSPMSASRDAAQLSFPHSATSEPTSPRSEETA